MRATRVQDLRLGLAKVKGQVVAQEELLTSPMGRKPCVYYHFLVEEMRRTRGTVGSGGAPGPGDNYWETVIDDKQGIDILLEDGTGQVDVRLQEADVDVRSEQSQTSGMFTNPPERLKRVIENRYGKSTKGLLFNKHMRYTETFLEDEAKVIAVGEVERGRGGTPRLVSGAIPLMISDKGEKKLGGPYRRREVQSYVVAGFILVFSLFLTVVAGIMASRFSKDPDPPRNAGGPGPNQQQPPNPQQPGPAGQPVQGGVPPKPGAELDPFLTDLRSPDANTRKTAAEKIRDTKVIEARRAEVKRELEALLSEQNPVTVVPALKALEKWGDKGTVPLLLRLREPRNAPYHNQVYMTLGAIPDEQSASTLAAQLGDKDESGLASAALRIMGAPAEQAVLRQLQTSKDENVQVLACATLGSIGTKASLPVLERLAASGDIRLSGLAKRSITDIQERLAGR